MPRESGHRGWPWEYWVRRVDRTKVRRPLMTTCRLRCFPQTALWEFQTRHKSLPTGKEKEREEISDIAERLRKDLGVNDKALASIESEMLEWATSPCL